jgi:hypothetical protein
LGKLQVVEPDVAVQGVLQFLAGSEVMALLHIFDATVEPLNPLPGR